MGIKTDLDPVEVRYLIFTPLLLLMSEEQRDHRDTEWVGVSQQLSPQKITQEIIDDDL
jgi:hypothetical protein